MEERFAGVTGGGQRRIGIWGYGKYGKALAAGFGGAWSGRYQVTAVFDAALAGEPCESADGVVRDPADAPGLHGLGAFDDVVIATTRREDFFEVREALEGEGIPIARLGSPTDWRPARDFPCCAGAVLDVGAEGYVLSALDGIYGITCKNRGQNMLYLFDGSGRVVDDNWFLTDTDWYAEVLNYPRPLDVVPEAPVDMPGEWCAVTRMSGHNYCHFTFQCLDQVFLMERAGFSGRYILPRSAFAPQLLKLVGVGEDRVLWHDDLKGGVTYRFGRMFVLQARDERDGGYSFSASAPVLSELSEMVVSRMAPSASSRPRRLYVRRVGSRQLVGADELIARYGFEEMVPEEHGVEEQIALFRSADVVLCPHGANSTNAIYLRPGSSFVETFGAGWICPWCKDVLLHKGVRYLPVVQSPVTSTVRVDNVSNYEVDLAILEMAIRNAIDLADIAGQRG